MGHVNRPPGWVGCVLYLLDVASFGTLLAILRSLFPLSKDFGCRYCTGCVLVGSVAFGFVETFSVVLDRCVPLLSKGPLLSYRFTAANGLSGALVSGFLSKVLNRSNQSINEITK